MCNRKNMINKSTTSSIMKQDADKSKVLTKQKKSAKHSRKFVRTQTGCLQCRQKKKKCDGVRPTCQSCTKRGIVCEFPANIRFFQFSYSNSDSKSARSTSKSFGSIDTSSIIKQEPVDSANKIKVKKEQVLIPKLDTIAESHTSRSSADNTGSFQFQNLSIEMERSNSLASDTSSVNTHSLQSSGHSTRTPSLSSDHSDTESLSSFQPQTPNTQSKQLLDILTYDLKPFERYNTGPFQTPEAGANNTCERALNLANGGKSIQTILNNISIDLIKRSIQNLKYFDFSTSLTQDPLISGHDEFNVNQLDFHNTNEINLSIPRTVVVDNTNDGNTVGFKVVDEFLIFEE